jgi:broad specificity phosphatase PhoE
MNLYVLRNGETQYDLGGLCCSDPRKSACLTETGIRQAERLASALMYATAEVVYVSEFDPTQVTARKINQLLQLPVIVDPRLNEVKTGYDGKLIKQWHEDMAAHDNDWDYRKPGAESLSDVQARTYEWLDDVVAGGRDVLAITHETNLRMLAMRLDDLLPDQLWEANVPPQGEYRVDEIAQSTRLGV